jgi:hypothetical protein
MEAKVLVGWLTLDKRYPVVVDSQPVLFGLDPSGNGSRVPKRAERASEPEHGTNQPLDPSNTSSCSRQGYYRKGVKRGHVRGCIKLCSDATNGSVDLGLPTVLDGFRVQAVALEQPTTPQHQQKPWKGSVAVW